MTDPNLPLAETHDKRMTRDEWLRNEARRQCATHGHDWNIVQTVGGVPIRLVCEHPCGAPAYAVTPLGQASGPS